MSTKKRPVKVEIDYAGLLPLMAVNLFGIISFLQSAYEAYRYGPAGRRRASLSLFDPNRELWSLPIGILEAKFIHLPRKYLPQSEAELRRLCRQLIDRGEDEAHILQMQQGWPAGLTLDAHVDALWKLRSKDRFLFENIVRGRFGRALRRIESSAGIAGISYEETRNVLLVQAIIWCAFDVQLIAAVARVSVCSPLGELLEVKAGDSDGYPEIKMGSVLKKMRDGITELEGLVAQFETASEQGADEDISPEFDLNRELKPTSKKAKTLKDPAWQFLLDGDTTKLQWKAELDNFMPIIRDAIPRMRNHIDAIEAMGEDIGKNAKLLSFFAAWNAGLTPVDGVALALLRYCQAETALDARLTEAIAEAKTNARGIFVAPLPAFPRRPKKRREKKQYSELKSRATDLLDSLRRVQLVDSNWRTRDAETRELIVSAAVEEPSIAKRYSFEGGGRSNINRAEKFLLEMGARLPNAHSEKLAADNRHRVYWKLDVVPELRFFI